MYTFCTGEEHLLDKKAGIGAQLCKTLEKSCRKKASQRCQVRLFRLKKSLSRESRKSAFFVRKKL